MTGLRWRDSTILALLVVFALSYCLPQAPAESAKDKGKAGATAADASDPPSTSVGSSAADAKATAGKPKKTAEKKTPKRRGKQAAAGAVDSSEMPSGNSAGSGVPITGFGGQTTGAAGATSARRNQGNSKAVTTNSPPVGAGGARLRAATVRTGSGKQPGAEGKARGPSAVLNAANPIVRQVAQIQNRVHASLVSQKGVVGTGTGLDDDGNIVIRVYTTGADSPQIPKTVENVPVLEVLTGPIFPAQGRPPQQQRSLHPVHIGVSIWSSGFCNTQFGPAAGTIGCRLVDQNGKTYILSSNHVLAGDGVFYYLATGFVFTNYLANPLGLFGNPSATQVTVQVAAGLSAKPTPIMQPAAIDENCILPQPQTDTVGSLFAFVPFNSNTVPDPNQFATVNQVTGVVTVPAPFPPVPANLVDCAIATCSPKDVDNTTPPDGYGQPTGNLTPAAMGMSVQKYGRTTGQTFGTVIGVNVKTKNPSYVINLPTPGNPDPGVVPQVTPKDAAAVVALFPSVTVNFSDEVEIVPAGGSPLFATAGDSGSLVVDMNNNPVALVRAFAGTNVFCGSIQNVFSSLQNQLAPQNIILSIDTSPSFLKSSQDEKLGRANPNSP